MIENITTDIIDTDDIIDTEILKEANGVGIISKLVSKITNSKPDKINTESPI